MPSHISARRVLRVSFAVDLIDVVTNLVVSLLTGSAVVFAEMASGLADSLGSLMLVVGEQRARRPRDAEHPFGHAREAFFWGLLSAVTMLMIGGGLSAWRGLRQLVDPQPLENPGLAVAVVALAVVTNSYAVSLSARKLAAEGGGLRRAFRNLHRPLVKNALLRDVVGVASSVLGLIALTLYLAADLVIFDAIGALIVALILVASSVFLIGQARELIIGRAVPGSDLESLHEAVNSTPEVELVNHLAAVYAGVREVLVDLDLDLVEGLDTTRIEEVLDDIEARVRRVVPETGRVRVELNSPAGEARSSPQGPTGTA